ncbi:DELTA-actitoxin-Aeq1a-like [Corythoichthys intestinalis]|uniref:DELTA-actitoxin-Aeq1a-like n=1 Tax=Corythoichthys intestinalis TaxID=161448 RepID=UPI0025A4FD00|nr:DELTA-actitoxin-Aeq1a-like [Corythoichthys intestinalis]XP_061807238.1 DELTA-actitoxin-Aeq1a-like [Nerophis lumbriciformis]
MPETAESHAFHLTTNRNCTIEVVNRTSVFCLTNPKVYNERGFPFSPPQPTVRVGRGEVCSFTKDDNTASGAVGVLTYELFHMHNKYCNEMVAVMFSVPFDYNFYKNWLGVGVYPKSRETDEKLYKEMYNSKDFTNFVRHEADGSGVEFISREVEVAACMSNEGHAIIKLEVSEK